MAAIKQMYHQVKVPLVENDAEDNQAENLSEYVFGKIYSPCCSNRALHQVPLKTDKCLENVINHYMGNFIKFLSTEEDVKNFFRVFDRFSLYLPL